MKIIKQGEIKPPSPPWWVGQQMTCPSDDTVVELEEGDQVKTYSERRPNGKHSISVKCPLCNIEITKTLWALESHSL